MKKIIYFLALFLSTIASWAQNLVPNPDFEDTLYCPFGAGGLAENWGSCNGSPDYFNSCSPCIPQQGCFGVPNNYAGTQNAYSGVAYAGIATASYSGGIREILIVELIDTLEIGKKYYFSCYVSRAYTDGGNGASNNFGFRFSTVEFDGINIAPIDNFSHYRDTTIITDTTNWTLVGSSFVADSSYRYLMLGNFYDDNHTDTMNMQLTTFPWNAAYYYVDYICVTLDSANCSIINKTNPEPENALSLYPNPCRDKLFFSCSNPKIYQLQIVDEFGRLIISSKISNGSQINTSTLESGFYFYSLSGEENKNKKGRIIKQ